jgi:hypothetical protein
LPPIRKDGPQEVLPLPLLPDGSLPASLEGEELVGLEFAYTSITAEGTDLRLESHTSLHLVRIQGTQNPIEVIRRRTTFLSMKRTPLMETGHSRFSGRRKH